MEAIEIGRRNRSLPVGCHRRQKGPKPPLLLSRPQTWMSLISCIHPRTRRSCQNQVSRHAKQISREKKFKPMPSTVMERKVGSSPISSISDHDLQPIIKQKQKPVMEMEEDSRKDIPLSPVGSLQAMCHENVNWPIVDQFSPFIESIKMAEDGPIPNFIKVEMQKTMS